MVNKWSRGRVGTWAVALALAACVPTGRGLVEDVVQANCALEMEDRCQDTVDVDRFIIDGKNVHMGYHRENGMCSMNCIHNKLDDVAWPRFPRLVNCSLMVLAYCAPPANTSYIEALRALNMRVSGSLLLLFMPADANVTAHSLRDAPPYLKTNTTEADGVLEQQPGALTGSSQLREQILENVRADVIPPLFRYLRVNSSSSKIKDHKLLNLATPALETLSLYYGNLEVLNAGFARGLGWLRELELELMRGHLPDGFLRGAVQLRKFKAVHCELVTLPKDLFSYSLYLEHIDLSRNNLHTLPPGMFTPLRQLDTLLLMRNNLTTASLRALAPLTWLKGLGLSGNPLGDLCLSGHHSSRLSPLRNLTSLLLLRTGLSHFCKDWLSDMPALAELDLRYNLISSFECADLRVVRDATTRRARIDLSRNSLWRVSCSRGDYQDTLSDPIDTQGVTLVLSSALECNCDALWLSAVARERRVVLAAPRALNFCSDVRSMDCEDVLRVIGN